MKTITIQEEVRIPGTDVILEKGDTIQIAESRFSSAIMDDIKQYIMNSIIDRTDPLGSGAAFISELDIALGDQVDEDVIIEFYQGMKKRLESFHL